MWAPRPNRCLSSLDTIGMERIDLRFHQAGSSAGRTGSRSGAEWSSPSDPNALLASAERKHPSDTHSRSPGIAVGRDPGGGELLEGGSRRISHSGFAATTSPPQWHIFTCRNGGNWRYHARCLQGPVRARQAAERGKLYVGEKTSSHFDLPGPSSTFRSERCRSGLSYPFQGVGWGSRRCLV